MEHRLDRDGGAHRSRERVNASAAAHSLEDWALSVAPARPGADVLDLGCGTGKLALPYGRAVAGGGRTARRGTVLGVDISADSLGELRASAGRAGVDNIETAVGELDGVVGDLRGRAFDLIVSSYAIYYSADVPGLIGDLRELLRDGGRVFVCGPGDGTNRQMYELVRSAAGDEPDGGAELQCDFISPGQIAAAGGRYASAERFRLPNEIRFADPAGLLGWWRNHNSYVPAADAAVERAVADHFKTHGEFRLAKNVLGVLFRA